MERHDDPRAGARAFTWVAIALLLLIPFWCWVAQSISQSLRW